MQSSEKSDLLSTAGYGIIVERDDEEIFTGFTTQIEPKWSRNDDLTIISGYSDERILWDQLAFPCDPDWADVDGLVFSTDEYDVVSGVAETVMKAYVSSNFADSDRRVAGASAISIGADIARGSSVIGRARFQFLGDLLTELAIAGGDLGFYVRGGEFDVYEPRDLSDAQIFSEESGNLESYSGTRKAPTATDVITAGGGEGTARIFARNRDTARENEWNRHIEVLADARDTSNLTELSQRGDKTLSEGAEVTALDVQAIDRPNREFGRDWRVGDYVRIGEIPAVVREARLSLDKDGETVRPTIDSVTAVSARDLIMLFDEVRALKRQVNYLQRTR